MNDRKQLVRGAIILVIFSGLLIWLAISVMSIVVQEKQGTQFMLGLITFVGGIITVIFSIELKGSEPFFGTIRLFRPTASSLTNLLTH